MQLLLVAATAFECNLLMASLPLASNTRGVVHQQTLGRHQVSICITGVGMVNTAWQLSRALQQPYDLLIHLGVCGSYDDSLAVGSVVQVVQDAYSELGADDQEVFLDMQALGFVNFTASSQAYYNTLTNPKPLPLALPQVRGITVNRVHGEAASIARTKQQWQPQVESMEGAAFFQAALMADVPFVALRGISNRVEPRNRAAWQLNEAAEAAQHVVQQLILDLP